MVDGDGEFVDDGGEGIFCGFVAPAEVLMEAARDRVRENDSKWRLCTGRSAIWHGYWRCGVGPFARTAVVTKRGGAYEGGHFAFG
jgi:hypothetical protein